MSRPLIYISFGMAKSGSTLAFELATAILEEAGIAQIDLDLSQAETIDRPRFVNVIRPVELAYLKEVAEARAQGPIAIKTHGGLWRCVAEGLDQGWIIGHAVCRDPRDVALSMMDASRKGEPWGRRNGQPLRHVEDALDYVRGHVKKFRDWALHPAILPLSYERVAFDTEAVAGEIARQLGVEADAARVARMAKAARTNFNVARPRRHEKEMSPAVSAQIRDEFADFIDKWCDPGFEAPKQGLLDRLSIV